MNAIPQTVYADMGLIGTIIGLLGKSKKIQKISKRLGKELTMEELSEYEDEVLKLSNSLIAPILLK